MAKRKLGTPKTVHNSITNISIERQTYMDYNNNIIHEYLYDT